MKNIVSIFSITGFGCLGAEKPLYAIFFVLYAILLTIAFPEKAKTNKDELPKN